MKKLIEETEDGLEALMGGRVTFYCGVYIYTGKLIGVNEKYVLLTDASVVYETGSYLDNQWKDAQKLPHDWYVMLHAVESFGVLK